MYRYRLGKSPTGANLVTNGDFNGSLTGWTVTVGTWNYMAGTAQAGGGAIDNIQQQLTITRGADYRLTFDVVNGFDLLGVYFGAYLREYKPYDPGTYTIDRQMIGTVNYITFACQNDTGAIDNVDVRTLTWNAPLNDEPISSLEYTIERDRDAEGVTMEYSGDITFYGDGYDYLYNLFQQGFCSEIPVLIETSCDGQNWETHSEGVIYLTNVEFDLIKCTAKANLEDRFNQKFKNAKNVDVYLDYGTALSTLRILPQNIASIYLHDSSGNYTQFRSCFDINKTLQLLVVYATNMELEFSSPLFGSGGDYEYLSILTGSEVRDAGLLADVTGDIQYSFKKFYEELNKIFNLGWRIVVDSDGVGTVTVDYKENFYDTTILFTVTELQNLMLKTDSENLPRNVEIGYDIGVKTISIAGVDVAVAGDDFMRGKVSYITDNKCSDKDLDLVSRWVQVSQVFFAMFSSSGTDTSLDDKIFVVEAELSAGVRQSKKTGTNTYNANIDADDNVTRWVESLPSSLYKDDTTYAVVTKTNNPKLKIYSFDCVTSITQFQTVRSNPVGKIAFVYKGSTYDGWIMEFRREDKSGLTNITLISE